MKKYSMLTQEEKQLYRDYHLWCIGDYIAICVVLFAFILHGNILIQMFIVESFKHMPTMIIGLLFYQLAIIFMIKKIKKNRRLVFGFDNINRYMFEINKKNLKISMKEMIDTKDME